MMGKKRIAVIGLGPMGQVIATLYLNNHYEVTVWNRTANKADRLVEAGAKRATAITELLHSNETIILSLTDYNVMYTLLNPETQHLKGKTFINLSSDTPGNARNATRWMAHHGASHITGAIMVEPDTLGQAGALIFYSADQSLFAGHKSLLEPLGKAEYLGEDPGLAQLFSIGLLNILFTTSVAILQSTALIQQAGISLPIIKSISTTFSSVFRLCSMM